MSNAVSQSEFAKILGVGRSYVTALKTAGRLVFDESGAVLVAESKKLIADTAGAPERASVNNPEFNDPRIKKDHYDAELKKIEYEKAIGKVVERSDVEQAIADVVTTFRQALENLPHRTAPELVGKDLDAIRSTLKLEVHAALTEMEREFSKRLESFGAGDQ